MLNLFLYHLSSGQAWFSCGMVFLLAVILDLAGFFDSRPVLARWLRMVLLIAMVLAAASATPLPLPLALVLVVSCLGYLSFGLASSRRKVRLILGSCAGCLILTGLFIELPYHWTQPPRAMRPKRIYIIGDSLTAGMGGESTTWPKILGQQTGIEMRDLSFAGANTNSAQRKLAETLAAVSDPNAWILIGIGGNDMLGPTSAADFALHLDSLLTIACADSSGSRIVLMQELPMIPFAWNFAAHQRRLAAKHGVVLIPKRLLASVVLADDNVVDGLHLSPAGHERMAELLEVWVGQ
jgi:lysophospholipase L1-like esterase